MVAKLFNATNALKICIVINDEKLEEFRALLNNDDDLESYINFLNLGPGQPEDYREQVKNLVLFLDALVLPAVVDDNRRLAIYFLSTPMAVFSLVSCGGRAEDLMNIIYKLEPAEKVEVLSTPFAVRGLLEAGCLGQVMEIICDLDSTNQVELLSTGFVASTLVEYGQTEMLENIINGFVEGEDQERVLSAAGIERGIFNLWSDDYESLGF